MSIAGTAKWYVMRPATWEDTKDGRLLVELISALAMKDHGWSKETERPGRHQKT